VESNVSNVEADTTDLFVTENTFLDGGLETAGVFFFFFF
jgi:hypothetical protein